MRLLHACCRGEGGFSLKQRRAYERGKYHSAKECPHYYNWFPRDKNIHKRLPDEGAYSRRYYSSNKAADTRRSGISRATASEAPDQRAAVVVTTGWSSETAIPINP